MIISKPAKELAVLLQTKVMLERVDTEPGFKQNGDTIRQLNIVSNNKNQFVINYGVGADNYEFGLTQDQAFEALASAIQKHGDRIKFHALLMPARAGLEHCVMDLNSDVIMRAIEYYDVRIDEILIRYDVLVEKVIKNV